jgi:hypothetical protein
MPYCSNCGKQIEEGAKYCSSCGSNLTVKNMEMKSESVSPVEMKSLSQTDSMEEETLITYEALGAYRKAFKQWLGISLWFVGAGLVLFLYYYNYYFDIDEHKELFYISIVVLVIGFTFMCIAGHYFNKMYRARIETIAVPGTRESWLSKCKQSMESSGFTNVKVSEAVFQVSGDYETITLYGRILITLLPEENQTRINIQATAKVDNGFAIFKNPPKAIISQFKKGLQ